MSKFVLGFVVGLIASVVIGVVFILVAMWLSGKKAPIADGSTLLLHLEGDLPEQAPVVLPLPFLESQQPLTMLDIWKVLRNAAADSRIKAVMLEPQNLSAGWAKLEEVRSDIQEFKKSGKPVYAYLHSAGAHEYYAATAADFIAMSDQDELDVKGLRAELMYFKGTLDKLGIDMEFEHIGKYKDAPDQYTRTSPTPETLEVENQILDQYFGDLVNTIAQGRKKAPEDVRAEIDDGPFVGQDAVKAGFIDALLYEDQAFDQLKDKAKLDEIKKVDERDYATVPASSVGLEGKSKIAFVVGEGDITRGGTGDTASSDEGITSTSMVRLLKQVQNDSSILGVILRIDSPGGDGIASDDILHQAKALAEKKPLVISMSDLAASGGYFIAATGDPIVAYPNTLTGSIGVFFGKPNLKGLFEKIGVTEDTLKRGRYAAIDTAFAPLSPDERAKLRTEIDKFYAGFVQRVSAARKRPYDQIDAIAQGRVWTGEQGRKNGLVDELGGIDRAIEMIKQRAKIPAGEKITLVPYPPRRSVWDVLLNHTDADAEIESRIRSKLGIRKLPMHALFEGGMLALMPFTIEVK